MYTLTLNTTDTSETWNGFDYPATPGNYKFLVEIFLNTDVPPWEQYEPWLYVQHSRFTDVYVRSFHKLAGEPNILTFHFVTSQTINAYNHATQPSVVWLLFPYDAAGNGQGFKSDLGTGLLDGDQIDCDTSASTVAHLTPFLE